MLIHFIGICSKSQCHKPQFLYTVIFFPLAESVKSAKYGNKYIKLSRSGLLNEVCSLLMQIQNARDGGEHEASL